MNQGTLAFVALAVVTVGLLFRAAVTRGYVLSQAQLLGFHFPWQAHRPPDFPAWPSTPLLDVPTLVYPFAAFFRSAVMNGEFPLWTNAAGSGFPFLATFQSALLSPFTWLCLVMPLPEWTVVSASLRLLVGGLGMFVFARRLGLSDGAAAVGGASYLLNPFTVLWLEHPLGGVPPWVPWLLVAADAAVRGGWGAVAALAACTGLVIAGGHPHTGAAGASLGGFFACFAAWRSARPRAALARVTVGLAVGAALVAVQVLPFLEYLSLSRAYDWRNSFALNPFHQSPAVLPTLALPQFWGHPDVGNYIGPSNYLEQTLYVGVPTLLIASVSLVSSTHRAMTWFFGGVATFWFLVIMGTPGLLHVISVIPLLKAASLPRFMLVVTTAASVLAAIGFESLRERRRNGRPHRGLVVLAVATAVLVAACGGALEVARDSLTKTDLWAFTARWTLWAVCLAIGTLAVAMAMTRRLVGVGTGAALAATLVTVDLLVFAWDVHRLIPREWVFPSAPEISRIQFDPDLSRVVGTNTTFHPNAAMAYGLQDARSYDGLDIRHYRELLLGTFGSGVLPSLNSAGPFLLLNLLNVKYVMTEPGLRLPEGWFERVNTGPVGVFRNTRVLPRAFLVSAWRVVDDGEGRDLLERGTVDSRRCVLLASAPDPAERPEAAIEEAQEDVTIVHYANNSVDLEVHAAGRRLLVLSDTYFPGWRATVDGQPVKVHRANVAFRAISVPAGRHRVRFAYRPDSVRIGGAISAASLAVVIGLSITAAWPRRKVAGRVP